MRFNSSVLLLLSVSLMSACGNKDGGSSGPSGNEVQNETAMADGSNIQGVYATTLLPVNNNIHMLKVGTAAIQRDGDMMNAFVKLKYGQRGTTLKQGIYTGTRCPQPSDDKNKDAYIDIKEALPVIGNMIIPLDGVLDSQIEGSGGFPSGDTNLGGYFYKSTGSFARMFADLKAPDHDPDDNLIKLKPEEGLSLHGKVVILHGVNERVFLPPTAATTSEGSAYKTIPVACGILKKTSSLPAELTVTTP